MEKTIISVNVPNVISIGVILLVVLVLYAVIANYAAKWNWGGMGVVKSGAF